jgi:hypothetical protein
MFLTTLGFQAKNIPLILSGKKTATLRLWDTPLVNAGDLVVFTESHHGKPFAVVRISSVEQKTFDELDEADKNDSLNNDQFENFQKKFVAYYHRPIHNDTVFTLVRFRIIDDGQHAPDEMQQAAEETEEQENQSQPNKT